MIYSPRAQPSVNKSRAHEVSWNNLLIYHTGEVDTHLTNKQRRINLSRGTVDCQINIPISIY